MRNHKVHHTHVALKRYPKTSPDGIVVSTTTHRLLRLVLGCLILCLTLTIGFSSHVHAQGGSNYTIFGLGDIRSSVGAAYEGMGGAAYSTPSDYTINSCNPALWTDVKTTRLQGGYRFNQILVSQSSGNVGNNNGKLDGAAVMFALDTTVGVSACLGVFPSSSINYLFTKPVKIALPDSGQSITGSSTYSGSGGLVTGFLGGAFKINDRISVGASLLLHFGLITDKIETQLNSEAALNSITTNQDHLSAVGTSIGIQTRPFDNWTFGAAATLNGNLSFESDLNYLTAQGGTVVSYDSTLTQKGSSSMPMTFGLGTSYRTGKFLLAADAELQSYSSVTYRSSSLASSANATRVSVGMSRIGSQSAGTAYVDRMNLNLGLGYRALNYTFNGTHISESYASVGAQMPFGGAAMVDAALVFGMRGTTDNGLISEKFARLSVTISVGEVWFIPFKRE